MNFSISTYVICSTIIATSFQFMPTSEQLIFFKPNLLLLNSLGWIISVPKRFGLGFSAVMGLIYDLISGSFMGINMIAFVLTSAIPVYLMGWLSYLNLKQRCLFILVIVLFYELFNGFLYSFFKIPLNLVQIFLASIISMLIWPIFDLCIRKITRNKQTQHAQR